MKRLLCIVGSMNAGGAETFLMKMYRQLDKSKYQMDFAVAINEEGFYDKEISAMGGRIYHITPKSMGILRNFNSIKKLVHNEKYEFVLRTSQHSLSALELFAAKQGGAKIRVFRSSNSNTMSGSKKEMILHKAFRFMPKYFANVRIAPSTEAAEFMFGKGCIQSGKVQLLHNAVDTDYFCYNKEFRKKHRDEFNITDEIVVGHVGRFSNQKNHKFLLDIFYGLSKINSNVKLILVGTGELKDRIKTQIHEYGLDNKVILTGVREDVNELLSAFDVFLFPSFYEGMPNTVIEAQATGLPCVISDTITKEANITGLVVYESLNNNVEEWVSSIVNSLGKKRENTKTSFEEMKYDINSVVQEFVQLVFENN